MADKSVLKAMLAGLASAFCLAGGLWLFEQLRNPISDVRLRLSELADNVKEATR
jgi:hypothetical protein